MSKQHKVSKKQSELNTYKFDTASYVKIPAIAKKAEKRTNSSSKKEPQPQPSV
jgi:hypothetical protein